MLTAYKVLKFWIILFILSTFLQLGLSSRGDDSIEFRQCLFSCYLSQCNNTHVIPYPFAISKPFKPKKLSFVESIITWNCEDECKYHCMWWVTEEFESRGEKLQQFYGRWPQLRMFGAQEPASAFFSVLNLVAQLMALRKFLGRVQPKAPIFRFWLLYAIASVNAWFWSTVFHIYDTRFTERMDYCSAYALVGTFFIATLARVTVGVRWKYFRYILLLLVIHQVLSYVLFILFIGRLEYDSHLTMSITIGLLTILCWLLCMPRSESRDSNGEQVSCRGIQITVVYIGVAATLEVFDFPAVFRIFDAHSLWHAATVPIYFPIFSFATKDCRNLHRLELKKKKYYGNLEPPC
ncbi:hypothetical protein Aperf_G00000061877 [Anoplocephala perfoliata]